MLADKVELRVAVGVAPQPSLRAVVPGAVLVPSGQVPERNRHLVTSDPLPRVTVLGVAHRSHPVLRRGVATMPTPQLPADEALQRRVALVDQGSSARTTER